MLNTFLLCFSFPFFFTFYYSYMSRYVLLFIVFFFNFLLTFTLRLLYSNGVYVSPPFLTTHSNIPSCWGVSCDKGSFDCFYTQDF